MARPEGLARRQLSAFSSRASRLELSGSTGSTAPLCHSCARSVSEPRIRAKNQAPNLATAVHHEDVDREHAAAAGPGRHDDGGLAGRLDAEDLEAAVNPGPQAGEGMHEPLGGELAVQPVEDLRLILLEGGFDNGTW